MPVVPGLPVLVEAVGPLSFVGHVEGAGVVLLAQATFALRRGAEMELEQPRPIVVEEIPPRPLGMGAVMLVRHAAAARPTPRIRVVRDRVPLLDEAIPEESPAHLGCVKLRGDEWVLLESVTRPRDIVASKLPSMLGRASLTDACGRTAEVPMQLDTVIIDGPEQLVRIVYRLELTASIPAALRVSVSLSSTTPVDERATIEIADPSPSERRPRSTPFVTTSTSRERPVALVRSIPGAPWDESTAEPVIVASAMLSHTIVHELPIPAPAAAEPVVTPPGPAAVSVPAPPASAPRRRKTHGDIWAKRPEPAPMPPPQPKPARPRRGSAPATLQRDLYGKFNKG